MINSQSAHDVLIITKVTNHDACFRSRSFQNRVFYPLTCLLLLIMVMLANLTDLSAQEQGCKYLGQYMAPFKPPIENWSTDLAGPAPGDVEVRMVGPQECRIITEQKITNAKGTAYRHITMAVSGCANSETRSHSLLIASSSVFACRSMRGTSLSTMVGAKARRTGSRKRV